MPERATALAIADGYITPPETDADDLHNFMAQERINIELFVPLLVRGQAHQVGDVVEVSRERAKTLIKRGHAKPMQRPQQEYEKMESVQPAVIEKKKETATRRRRTKKA